MDYSLHKRIMKRIISIFSYLSSLCLFLNGSIVKAQIESDKTLLINSNVIRNGLKFTINGGTVRGNNLFHSFQKFNVPTGGEAFLNNANSIENIFTRVTGGSISNIDGIIKANGSANLFLMNPSGIVFGENARLNIGGSFLGTTAENIKFSDGNIFSAINPQAPPLLTINVPVGLQMGINPGEITVNGSGHNLKVQDINFSPYINPGSSSLLRVKPGKNLSLIGEDIKLNGATLNAAMGRIELSSFKDGELNLNKNTISPNSKFGNIQLSQQSLIDVSGAGAGSIQIKGDSISLNNGSLLLIQNQGLQKAGDIDINAAESLEINGISADGQIRSAIVNETLAGNSGNINVVTPRLIIQYGAGIGSRTFSSAQGGNVTFNVSELIEIGGFSEINPELFSAIVSITFGEGKAGNISIKSRNLFMADGSSVAATSFGQGDGGNIDINAQNVEVKGSGFGLFGDTNIASATFTTAAAGNININTKNMIMEGGATVNTTSFNNGDAGNITINAAESIQVIGQNVNRISTRLESIVETIPILQSIFQLPDIPNGNAGNITINTPFLLVTDGAYIGVQNSGTGDAGVLKVNADFLRLNNLGNLSATTNDGDGGNILLKSQSLQMRRGSSISTSAGATG